jgi:hypothetical protein
MIDIKLFKHFPVVLLLLLLWSQIGSKAFAQQQLQPGMTDVRALTEADGPTNLAATEDQVCFMTLHVLNSSNLGVLACIHGCLASCIMWMLHRAHNWKVAPG